MDDLIRILNNFDPKRPLDVGTLPLFYQPRQTNVFRQLETACLASDTSKVLFTGMIGSGKTTELNYFALNTELKIFSNPISDDIDNIFNLTIEEFLSNTFISFMHLVQEKLNNNQNALSLVYKFLNFDVNLESGRLHNQILKGLAVFLNSNSSFKINNYKEFFRTFNLLVNEFYPQIKPVLLIDGLDKLTAQKAKELFYDGGSFIKDLPLKMIITIPFELSFDEDFFVRKDDFYTSVVPLPALYHMYIPNVEYFKEIIRLRLQHIITVSDDIINLVITYSGGLLRHLILLFRETLSSAIINNQDELSRQNVDYAVQNLADDYQKILSKEDLIMLREFKETKIWLNDYKMLLKKQAILYYNSATNYDIHPIVMKILIDNR